MRNNVPGAYAFGMKLKFLSEKNVQVVVELMMVRVLKDMEFAVHVRKQNRFLSSCLSQQ